MMITSLPKICAAAVLLAACSIDGRILTSQTGCNHGRLNAMVSPRMTVGFHPQTGHLMMNSLLRDPWADRQHDLWHDPWAWGHQRLSLRPWGESLAPWGPYSSLTPLMLGCRRTGEGTTDGHQMPRDGKVIDCQGHCQDAGDHIEAEGEEGAKMLEKKAFKEETDERTECQERQQGRESLRKEAELHRAEAARRSHDEVKEWRRRQEEEVEMRREAERLRWRQEEERMRQRQEAERQRQKAERQRQRREEEEARIRREERLRGREAERQRQEEERMRQKQEAERQRQRREQEAARIRREERLRARQEESTHQNQRPQHQPHQGMKTNARRGGQEGRIPREQRVEVATLNVPGYSPEDISIRTSGSKLLVSGKHVCDCGEQCTAREFQERVAVPQGVDLASLNAKLTGDGRLTVTGSQGRPSLHPTDGTVIPVKGDGSFPPRSSAPDPSCGGRRGRGIKLTKMNKRTGELLEDYKILEDERTFEDEVDEDGVTMEVEY